MEHTISVEFDAPCGLFAASELKKALAQLQAPEMRIRLLANDCETDGFTVDMNFPEGRGFIRGSNPRSVLFGVYRLLKGLGFRWLRPGAAGEVVPPPPEKWTYMRFWEQASIPLRAVCIEGADSRENLLDMVDWMAKHFFNTYYLQSDSVYAFLDRYYSHLGNPLLAPEEFSRREGEKITRELAEALRLRGLTLQQFGHGPTGEILGLSHWGWDPEKEPVTEEIKPYLAQINGVRDLWHKNPKYTQLCYSNPVIQEKLAERVVELIQSHPEAGLVNFFLSDHHHNFCECENCVRKRPTDWYVMILNKIDEKLTALGNKIKIGFAVYYDLLWPPAVEKFNNPERFLLIACPVTRSYAEPFFSGDAAENIPEYLQNISPYPTDNREIRAFYNAWKNVFSGRQVVFDYHYMWDLHRDYSGFALPELIHADAAALDKNGFSGFISCQNQRAFYPNSLGMTVLAEALWNSKSTFEQIAENYFEAAYGENSQAALDYFKSIKNFFPVHLLRGTASLQEKQKAAELLSSSLPRQIVEAAGPALASGCSSSVPAVRESWEILRLHTEQLLLACRALATLWSKGEKEAAGEIAELFDWARKNELRLQSVFDVYEYLCVSITATGVDRNTFMNRLGKEIEADLAEI